MLFINSIFSLIICNYIKCDYLTNDILRLIEVCNIIGIK